MKYKRIDECTVDAVQLSFDTFREVEEWLTNKGFNFSWDPKYVSISLDTEIGKTIRAYIGDYIVSDRGSLLVYNANDFEHIYEVEE